MTVKVLAIEQPEGGVKYFAYHAHIVYHGNPDDDDFDPDDNHVVEVMAELPNPAALATWRDPMPVDLANAAANGAARPGKVLDVICPDPMCGSTSTYPSNGDPDARTLHAQYREHIGTVPQIALSQTDHDILAKIGRGEPLDEGETMPRTATERLHIAVHGRDMAQNDVSNAERQQYVEARAIEHKPIRAFVANDWALRDMGLPVPELAF